MFRKIVVPTDFSEPAAAALELARELARPLGTMIELLHVIQLPRMSFPDGSSLVASPEETAEMVRSAGAKLKAAAGGVTTSLVEGALPDAIIEAAGPDDLIIMGTHGRGGLSHLILGSVAERVLRAAKCPVLTVGSAAIAAQHVVTSAHA